jgi:hypothetical protein
LDQIFISLVYCPSHTHIQTDITLKTTFFDSGGTNGYTIKKPKIKFKDFHKNNSFSIYYHIGGESNKIGFVKILTATYLMDFLWIISFWECLKSLTTNKWCKPSSCLILNTIYINNTPSQQTCVLSEFHTLFNVLR